jgi:hypothetical protein
MVLEQLSIKYENSIPGELKAAPKDNNICARY